MKATVKKVIEETPRVYTLVIEPDEPVSFKTGQCMRIEALGQEGTGGRLFSMANAGGDSVRELWFTIRIIPGGRVSSHIPELTPGDRIDVSGPFGKFIFDDTEKRDIALIAGGSGISVLRAIYQHVLQKGMPNNISLLFSVLNRDEIIYKQELEELATKHPNFKYAVTLTEENPPNWHGHCGIINEQMFEAEFGPGKYQQAFFVCGPPRFIKCAEDILKEKGVAPENIHIDRWVFN